MLAESRDPATGQVWRTYPTAGPAEVERAVAQARGAQRAWGARPLRERVALATRFHRALYERRHEVADVIARENGKPAAEAMAAEVVVALDLARYYASYAPAVLADRRVRMGNAAFWRKRLTITYEPFGVIGIISPWNYPFMLAAGCALPALIAGNAVVLKPSEYTPTTGLLLGELLAAAGAPEGLVHVLTGDGGTGAALTAAAVDKVFFTGSARAGRAVAHACAERLVPCVLELGGTDPAIVLADADIEIAASGIAWGRFSNAGQTCVAPKQVYVVERVYERFVERFAAAARSLRVGPATDPGSDVGPMIRDAQCAVLDAQLHDAVARGARVVAGGAAHDGSCFFPPTVLVDVAPGSRVLTEETFGPVVPVIRVRDAEEAIRLANASGLGLSASVWGRDLAQAERVARAIEAGSVMINDTVSVVGIAEAPHGGVKGSGFGRSHGAEGLAECVRAKAIVVDRLAGVRQPWWFGYSAERARNTDAFVRFRHGARLAERVRAVPRVLRLLRRGDRAV